MIELKYDKNLNQGCKDALSQIEEKRYAEELQNEGMETILKYGISCYKKTCRVVLGE